MPADDAARAPVGRPAWGGAAQRLGPAPSGIREALEAGGADRLRESSPAAQPGAEGAWGGPPPACRWPGGAAALIAAGGDAPRAPRVAAPAAEGLSALLAEARRSRPDISGVLSALCASRNDSLLSGILTKACVVVAPQVQGSWDVVPSAPTAGTHGVRITALRKHASLMRTMAAARTTRAGVPDWLCWTRVRARPRAAPLQKARGMGQVRGRWSPPVPRAAPHRRRICVQRPPARPSDARPATQAWCGARRAARRSRTTPAWRSTCATATAAPTGRRRARRAARRSRSPT